MDNKSFLDRVEKESGLEKGMIASLTEALISIMEENLASGFTVSIPSFGNFEPRKRNERIMSHPSSPGKRLLIPPKVVVNFKPSAILKNKINEEDE